MRVAVVCFGWALAIAFAAQPSAAQDASRFASGPAEVLPGGDWAIGYWQGNLVKIGTGGGTAGLTKSPRTLVVEREASGGVACRWLGHGPSTPTQRCQLGKDRVAVVMSSGSEMDLSRSGPDALQGIVRWKGATGASGAGMTGTQVFLNRLTASPDFGWAVGLWRGKLEGFSFGGVPVRTLRIVANGGRPVCYWGIGENEKETTQGCLISASQISLVTSGSASVDLERKGNGLRGTFRTDTGSYDAEFQRLQ